MRVAFQNGETDREREKQFAAGEWIGKEKKILLFILFFKLWIFLSTIGKKRYHWCTDFA